MTILNMEYKNSYLGGLVIKPRNLILGDIKGRALAKSNPWHLQTQRLKEFLIHY